MNVHAALRFILIAFVGAMVVSGYAHAEPKEIAIPAGDLISALQLLAEQAGVEFAYHPDQLKGLRTQGISGTLEPRDAVSKLLEGTPLRMRVSSTGEILIELSPNRGQSLPNGPESSNGTIANRGRQQSAQEEAAATPHLRERPNDPSEPMLEEVIVTAAKRPESIQETPASVSVLTADTIALQGLSQFNDYMPLVPGLAENSNGAPGHALVILRGLGTGVAQQSSTVSYIVDDVIFTSNSSLSMASMLFPDLDLADVERIEVLKGPQGTLYGASALGGIIKIVSKQPVLDSFSAEARAGISTVDRGGDGYALRAALNVPIIPDTAALRISAFQRSDPGYMKNVENGLSETNRADLSGGRIMLRLNPTSALDIELTGLLQNLRSDGSSVVEANPVTLLPTRCAYCYAAAVGPLFNTHYRLASAVANWQLPAGTITNSLSYARYDDTQVDDYTASYGIFNSLLGIPVPPNFATLISARASMRKTTEELRFASNRLGNLEFLGGLFWTYEHNERPASLTNVLPPALTVIPIPGGDVFYNAQSTPIYEEYAAFADVTYYFSPAFDLTLGGRATYNDQHAILSAEGVLNGGNTADRFTSSDHPTTYLATLRFRPDRGLDTYARVATGYRPGGPQALIAPDVPKSFDPDRSTNYELGAKSRWWNERLAANLAIYYIDWNHIQLNQLIGGLVATGNGGKATSKGAELELAFVPTTGLTTQLTASFGHAYTNVAAPFVGAAAGDTLPLAPRFTGAFVADYEWVLTGAVRGNVGMTYAYQGSRPTTFSQDDLNPYFQLPGFGTLALRAGISWGKYGLYVRADNVTNKYTYTTTIGQDIIPGQGLPALATVIAPRRFTLEFSGQL